MIGLTKWLGRRDFVSAALFGIYFSLFPMAYCMVKIIDGHVNEWIFIYVGWCMMSAPALLFMLFNQLGKQMNGEEDE